MSPCSMPLRARIAITRCCRIWNILARATCEYLKGMQTGSHEECQHTQTSKELLSVAHKEKVVDKIESLMSG